MPVHDKPDGTHDVGLTRQARVSVEREVEVSRAVEHLDPEGSTVSLVMADQVAARHAHRGRSRERRRRRLRLSLVLGALALVVAPSLVLIEGTADVLADATLHVSVLLLKAISAVVALGAVSWRLRRHASAARRTGYFAGVWAMALGLGVVAARAFPLGGSLLFDAGVLGLLVLALGDDRLRGERPALAAV
jgi:hypothetical protein